MLNENVIYNILDVSGCRQHLFGNKNNNMIGYSDLIFINEILHRFSCVKTVVELGTHYGITSIYFGVSMLFRGGKVFTYDIVDQRLPEVKNTWFNNMEFNNVDLFSQNTNNIEKILNQDGIMIFIDNGNKVEEFNKFVPFLKEDAIILIHDWNSEIYYSNIKDTVNNYKLLPLLNDFSINTIKSRMSCFVGKKHINMVEHKNHRNNIVLGISTYNRLHYLKKTIPFVENFFDRIIICDTGSTDGTVEYFRYYNKVEIIQRKWDNSIANSYQSILDTCEKGDWFFYCDSDEQPSYELLCNLKLLINRAENNGSNMIAFPIIYSSDGKSWIEYLRNAKNNPEDQVWFAKRIVKYDPDYVDINLENPWHAGIRCPSQWDKVIFTRFHSWHHKKPEEVLWSTVAHSIDDPFGLSKEQRFNSEQEIEIKNILDKNKLNNFRDLKIYFETGNISEDFKNFIYDFYIKNKNNFTAKSYFYLYFRFLHPEENVFLKIDEKDPFPFDFYNMDMIDISHLIDGKNYLDESWEFDNIQDAKNMIWIGHESDENFWKGGENISNFFVEKFNLTKNDVVIDYGCGIGRISLFLHKFVKKIICVDSSKSCLDFASSILLNCNNIDLIHNKKGYFEDGVLFENVDFIFFYTSAQHIDKRQLWLSLKNLHKVLKDNGKIFIHFTIIEKNSKFEEFYHHINDSIVHYGPNSMRHEVYSMEELEFRISEAGYSILEINECGMDKHIILGKKSFENTLCSCNNEIEFWQNPDEWKVFNDKYLMNKNISIALEIGTYKGGTLFHICNASQNDALIISIDKDFEESFGSLECKTKFLLSLGKKGQEVKIITSSSENKNTILEVEKILKGRKIDLLFIDGGHYYSEVSKDFYNYSSMVSDGGTIVFHDIKINCDDSVADFWEEIKYNFEYDEIIIPEDSKMGIGIIKNYRNDLNKIYGDNFNMSKNICICVCNGPKNEITIENFLQHYCENLNYVTKKIPIFIHCDGDEKHGNMYFDTNIKSICDILRDKFNFPIYASCTQNERGHHNLMDDFIYRESKNEILKGQYEWVVFMDSDVFILNCNWIEDIVNIIKKHSDISSFGEFTNAYFEPGEGGFNVANRIHTSTLGVRIKDFIEMNSTMKRLGEDNFRNNQIPQSGKKIFCDSATFYFYDLLRYDKKIYDTGNLYEVENPKLIHHGAITNRSNESHRNYDEELMEDLSKVNFLEGLGLKWFKKNGNKINIHGKNQIKNNENLQEKAGELSMFLDKDSLEVGAFYYIWFENNWQKKTARGILDQSPTLGWYNSFDEKVISQHIDWANEYGIDFFIICVDKRMVTSEKIGKFVNLYREICKNKEKFPKITFQLETLSFFDPPPPIRFASEDVKSLESFIDCITYLREIYDENLWHTIDGKPSLFIYAAREIKERCDLFCETIKDFWKTEIHISGDVIFHGFQPNEIVKCFDSLYYYNMYIHQIEVENVVDNTDKKIYDKYLDMVMAPLERYFKSERKMIIPSVVPRYNDRGIRIDKDHYVLPENRGMFFKQYLRRIKSYLKSGILLITSFNEWYEDTQIEPCGNKASYGNSCIEPKRITEGYEHYSYYEDYLKIIKDFKDEFEEVETIEVIEQQGSISTPEKIPVKKEKFKMFDNSNFDVTKEKKIEIPLNFEFSNPIIDVKNVFGENIFMFSLEKIVADEQNGTAWFQIRVGNQTDEIDVNLLSRKFFIEYSPLVVDSEIKAITLKIYDNIHLNFEKLYKL